MWRIKIKRKKGDVQMAGKVGELTVKIKTTLDGYTFEKIEDLIRDLLEEEGIEGEITCSVTGNTTVTRREEMHKKEKEDITVNGQLILGDKIWFNDDLRCRLRICGFSKKQRDAIRNAKLIDITITDYKKEDIPGAVVHISEFGKGMFESSFEERC